MERKKNKQKIITPLQALNKARRYCAYQERCQQDLRKKLYEWQVPKEDAEAVMAVMISEGFINEERFAKAYASGHLRLKKWGKNKIKAGLKQKGISDYSIRKALESIDEFEYRDILFHLLKQKMPDLPDKRKISETQRLSLISFAMAKGWEYEIINETIEDIFNE